jgi:CDGSH-type Zn-finger protein
MTIANQSNINPIGAIMPTKITVKNNGSLIIDGPITLVDGAGNEYDLAGKEKLFFCRCGHSANKPFCDGQHRAQGFESVCEAHSLQTA